MKLMENKVVLITGAAQGIGFAAAKAFAEAGASVALADYDEDLVTKAAEQLTAKGYKTLAITCDVSDDEQVKAMVDKTVATFGRLDAAYNNAGVQNELAEAADQTKEDFDRVVSVNLQGVWSCMKYELQQMRKQGFGAIVNCSSIGGILGGAMRGTYHASKHGVIGLTKSAALEYAPLGIRINTICPGLIYTPMAEKMIEGGQKEALDAMLQTVPAGRYGKPEEMANAVVWLCSDSSSFIVGHTLVADGGYSIQ
ncbi:SDR family NAD(P)-dependent oxidoreductase [Cyclobacterium plantarum]|uniref:SDR family oxidoreductase n=1 Tax=Cyclobacterium plantarum TaxID=2716263 RepID=A0ABX0H7L2_9BACT|nr:glucose 1-dehydrogenase [Cyclobacterium plantarum]NHE55955.1 SDR family oxidoreductase [Cyclobacterium plantarum]